MSESNDTDGRGGGGGAILRAVNFEEVVASLFISGSRRVVETNLATLRDAGSFTSICKNRNRLGPLKTNPPIASDRAKVARIENNSANTFSKKMKHYIISLQKSCYNKLGTITPNYSIVPDSYLVFSFRKKIK